MRLVLRAAGPLGPADAWESYADLDRWSAWSPQIGRVDAVARRLHAGLRGRVVGPWPRLPLLEVSFLVEQVDHEARRWVWSVVPRRVLVPLPRGVSRAARLLLVHVVVPDGAGCATTLEVTGAAPGVLGYAFPAWVALRRLVRGTAQGHTV